MVHNRTMRLTKKNLLVTAAVAGLFAVTGQEARAAFELNFLPNPQGPNSITDVRAFARCNMGGVNAFCVRADGVADPDSTPFLREVVTIEGVTYVHMIVGSLTPDAVTGEVFAQETYIRAVSTGNAHFSFSGGRPGCDSGNTRCGGGANLMTSGNGQVVDNSAVGTPLLGNQQTTGIGTGDPTRAIIRQVMTSGEMGQEFLKAEFLLKPKITQSITANGINGISSQFVLDMSAINYTTSAIGTLVNTLTLNDPSLPVGSNFFDVTASAQSANVTGGAYTFASGKGWLDTTVHLQFRAGNPFTGPIVPEDNTWNFDAGSYTSSNGDSANLTNVDWQAFRNPLQNP